MPKNKKNNPKTTENKKILYFYTVVLLSLIILAIIPATGWFVLFSPYGMVAGPLVVLLFPIFDLSFQLFCFFGFIISAVLIFLGIKRRSELKGHFFIVSGLIIWAFLGTLGAAMVV